MARQRIATTIELTEDWTEPGSSLGYGRSIQEVKVMLGNAANVAEFSILLEPFSKSETGVRVKLTGGQYRTFFTDRIPSESMSFDQNGLLLEDPALVGSESKPETPLRFGVAEKLQIDSSDFASDHGRDRWKYIGPLDDLVDWFCEEFPLTQRTTALEGGSFSIVTERYELQADGKRASALEVYTAADSEEEAWRLHLGEALVSDSEPYAVLAEDGQTLSELKIVLDGFDASMSSAMPPGNPSEAALHQRWLEEVIDGREVIGFRDWVKVVSNRQEVPLKNNTATLDDLFDELVARKKASPAVSIAPNRAPGGGFQTTPGSGDFVIQDGSLPGVSQQSARPTPSNPGASNTMDAIDLWSVSND